MNEVQRLPTTAFDAFESQLKTLCLKEFPCGVGSWNEHQGSSKKLLDTVDTQYSVTLKNYGANHEKRETLEELVHSKKSPWNLDYSWSDEAKSLREIAVRSPWLIDDRFILQHFKTLRIVDKEISEVDERFLKFTHLESLTLSANYLQSVNSRHLPKKLMVLELCGNMISHLADLCMSPPPLVHLGLGHNLLTMVDDYITQQYWPQLLSLDLSHNNLNDLVDIVRKLQTLPTLRNLVMQGNPLSLVPGYRGYSIDSLRKLEFLDDLSISADERHQFRGLSKRKEYILDEAKIVLRVDMLKGIPMPEELKNPEDQPEFPIVSRKYYVQFMLPEDSSSHTQMFQMLQAEDKNALQSNVPSYQSSCHSQHAASVKETTEAGMTEQADSESQATDRHMLDDGNPEVGSCIEGVSQQIGGDECSTREETTRQTVHLVPIKSKLVQWAEDMELSWVKVITRDDLLALRDFCKQGMDFTVMEDKILSYPADQVHDGIVTPLGSKSAKSRDKSRKEERKDGKDEPKKKKKKGEPDVELFHMPPEVRTLAEFHINLSELLDGEHSVSSLFVKCWGEDEGTLTPAASETSSKKEKKDKKKPGSAKKKDEKDVRKSSKSDKKASDKGSKSRAGEQSTEDELAFTPAPPMEVQVAMTIHYWESAQDSLKQMKEENE